MHWYIDCVKILIGATISSTRCNLSRLNNQGLPQKWLRPVELVTSGVAAAVSLIGLGVFGQSDLPSLEPDSVGS